MEIVNKIFVAENIVARAKTETQKILLEVAPSVAGGDVDDEFDAEFGGDGLHVLFEDLSDFVLLRGVAFDNERVVDLHDEVCAFWKGVVDIEHGTFHEVGFGALDGHILGGALGGLADDEVAGFDIGSGAAAAVVGLDEALFPGLREGVFHILHNRRAKLAIVVHELFGVGEIHMSGFGEAIDTHAIDDAEVDGFGGAALSLGDLV